MKKEAINVKILNKLMNDKGVYVFDDGHPLTARDVHAKIKNAKSYKIVVHATHRADRQDISKSGVLKGFSALVYIYDEQGRETGSFLIDSVFETTQKNIASYYKMLNMDVTALDVYNLQAVSKYKGYGTRFGIHFTGAYIIKFNKNGKDIWQLQISDNEGDTLEFDSLEELLNGAEQLMVKADNVTNS